MPIDPVYGNISPDGLFNAGAREQRMAMRGMMLQRYAMMPAVRPMPADMMSCMGFYNNCLGSIDMLKFGFPMPQSFSSLPCANFGVNPYMMQGFTGSDPMTLMMFYLIYQQMQMQQMLLLLMLMQGQNQISPDILGRLMRYRSPYGNSGGITGRTGEATGTGALGNAPYNPVTGNQLADKAAQWSGRSFKPGETKRCADFVSSMIEQSGAAPKGFRHQVSCLELQKYGHAVSKDQLKPGDIIYFRDTYTEGDFTHVGIYLGNGKFSHRPTANKPVRIDNLNSGYYAQHYSTGRRLA